jgi:hypothetical protein
MSTPLQPLNPSGKPPFKLQSALGQQTQIQPQTPRTPRVQPPSVLLLGGVGSGKTYSISTLLESGLEVFVIVTEPVGLDSLLDVVGKKNLDINKLHYKSITPARPGFDSLLKSATKVSGMSYDDLTKLRPENNRQNAQWLELLRTLANFTCDRTGEVFGPVDQFDATRALVIDSCSGLNVMAMDVTIGDKPTAHQGEWGVAMQLLEKLLTTLSSGLSCPFVLTAHTEKEPDPMTGAQAIMASTLGRKLAPKVPRFFSEVVMAYRENTQFYWTNNAVGADLKCRSLPLGTKLEPSFKPVLDAYQKRLALARG